MMIEQPKAMEPDTVRDLVLDCIENGPTTLTKIMAAIAAHGAETKTVWKSGSGGLVALLLAMGQRGEVGCVRVGGRKDRARLVWVQAAEMGDVRRREAARRDRLTKRRGDPVPPNPEDLMVIQPVGKGGHDDDDTPPGPMEVLARLAGTTTYTTPGSVRSTRPGTTTDELDFVLSAVRDKLARDMAFTVATHSTRAWTNVHRIAAPRMLDAVRAQAALAPLVAEGKRTRVRVILHHVFHDLAAHRRRPYADGAKALKMRERDYRNLYGVIHSELNGLAEQAARDAVDLLRGKVTDFRWFLIASSSRPHQTV